MKRSPIKRTPYVWKKKPSKSDFLPDVKYLVRQRSKDICEAQTSSCRHAADTFHHIQRRSQGGPGTVENCLHVCSPCHTFIHSFTAVAYERGWLRRSSARPRD